MQVTEAIQRRRTVRGFKPDPVPDDLLRTIFQTAQLSPSNCNTQPWHVVVASGELRNQLEKALLADIESGKAPSPYFQPGDADLWGVYKERQYACAAAYYAVMGIERSDKAARSALMLKNWAFFGAPHVAIISMPKTMGPVNGVDVGIYLQSLMLLLVEHGLDSCAQGALAFYPDKIIELLDIPSDNAILCGLSFGYADEDAPINRARMDRANLADSVIFAG